MPKRLLSIPHQRQQHRSDCLAACASMVLGALEDSPAIPYSQLLKTLNIKAFGAPSRNILRLATLDGVGVVHRMTDVAGLRQYIEQGIPVIVFVRTTELPYWSVATDHAVVVVGFDEQAVFVHDPYFDEGPIAVSWGDFELAWLEHDYRYAVIYSEK